ncbi:MAG: chromate transporter [Clostridia bacterium]|nr:chromate transporter [Clostridia bacterium]
MVYWQIFLAFFIPSVLGYGGGPAIIPLIQNEVVNHYGWLTLERFGEILAIGNSLPGPIATKMGGYIGYEVGGILGAAIALFATVAPSLLAMLLLLGVLYKFKDSPRVVNMTALIRPTIGVLLGVLAYEFFARSWRASGSFHTFLLVILSYFLLEKRKVHPAYVIAGSLLYGAFIIA